MAPYDPALWDLPHTPGRLGITLAPGVEFDRLPLSDWRGEIINYAPHSYHIQLEFPSDSDAMAFAQIVCDAGLVTDAEPDISLRPASNFTPPPNDLAYPGNAGVPGTTAQTYLTQMNMASAWALTQGLSSVSIGIPDTHFQIDHPEIAANVLPNGWNYTLGQATLNTPANCSDTTFHGLRCAGIIGAATNNGAGIAGVAPNCGLSLYQCADSNATSNPGVGLFNLINAINLAVTNGNAVVSISSIGTTPLNGLRDAIAAATAAGLVIVAAGGDDAGSQTNYYPAQYPGVISVSSVDGSNAKSSWAGYGSSVNCAANGELACRLAITSTYSDGYGTSFSTPAVAGLAALMKSYNPGISGAQIKSILTSSAGGDATTGFTNSTVYAVNAPKALAAAYALSRPCFFLAA